MDRRDFLIQTGVLAGCLMLSPGLVPSVCAQEISPSSSSIQLRVWQYDLELRHTWTIARGSRKTSTITFVEIMCDGISGIGEAALSTAARYGETKDTVLEFLKKLDFRNFDSPFQLEDILNYIANVAPGNFAAKAAIDIALHDWVGKKIKLPLYQLWGLNPARTPITTFSIAIDTPEVMVQKVLEAAEYPVLKIKVGKDNDEEIIRAIRQVTQKPLRVDANEGWKTKELALERIQWLETQGVELIEQPLPTTQLADMIWLKERVNMPIFADESVLGPTSIPLLKDAFDGINIKLMKCGGLREAMKMIQIARALGMKVMMGCMIESSVAISAAAQLSPLLDYADLDGNLLITNDPYIGAQVKQGKVILSQDPGIGIKPRIAEDQQK